MLALYLSVPSSKLNYKPTLSKPSAWIAATHSLPVKKLSELALTQTAWHKRSHCSTKVLDLRALAVTADAERF